jgi:hypothetical protein
MDVHERRQRVNYGQLARLGSAPWQQLFLAVIPHGGRGGINVSSIACCSTSGPQTVLT